MLAVTMEYLEYQYKVGQQFMLVMLLILMVTELQEHVLVILILVEFKMMER